jgi:hypothetical protein
MEIPLKDETPEEEFITIIQNLVNIDLAALYQVLNLEDEKEQIQHLRKLRNQIAFYPELYNAYTARVLVNNPNYYIEKLIVSRFNKLYLY